MNRFIRDIVACSEARTFARCFAAARAADIAGKTALLGNRIKTAVRRVYQVLTIIGKDCGNVGQDLRIGAILRQVVIRATASIRTGSRPVAKRQGKPVMALKVELKPNERIIVGACVITNTDQRARLLIEGDRIPILREKDILTPETADTPAKLVYLAVQLMYLSSEPQVNHGTYFSLLRDIVTAVPSAWPIIEGINNEILNGDLYRALKEARKLIAYEAKLRDRNQTARGALDSHAKQQRSA